MLRRLRRPGVLPATMLVIIVLWALLAVLMLTNTLVAAQQIDNRVEVINGEVGPIDNELDSVVLAGQVAAATEQIRPAAAPLSGQLTETNKRVVSIDASAEKILATAEEINATAKEINPTVLAINENVNSIGAALTSVEDNVLAINGSVDGITASFSGVLSEVISIDDRVAGINRRADVIIGHSQGIAGNLTSLNEELVPDINFNAEAIEQNPLLLNGLSGEEMASINQLMAATALPAAPSQSPQEVPLPAVEALDLPLPAPAPLSEVGGILPRGPQQSPQNDGGSILGSVTGGL